MSQDSSDEWLLGCVIKDSLLLQRIIVYILNQALTESHRPQQPNLG